MGGLFNGRKLKEKAASIKNLLIGTLFLFLQNKEAIS